MIILPLLPQDQVVFLWFCFYSVAHPLLRYILLNVFLGNSPGWRAYTVANLLTTA